MPQLIISVQGVEIKHVWLTKDRTTLGRSADNDVVLSNPAVSGHHCVFELKGLAEVYVQDLKSTNGTFVNNQRIERQKLEDKDELAVSGFRIRYLAASDDSGFGATASMTLGPEPQLPPAGTNASFRVLSGTSAGLEVPVVKAVTTFGKPGVSVISVSHRQTGYFAHYLDGTKAPLLNDKPLGQNPVLLSNGDEIDLLGTKMQFVLQ